MAGNLWDIIYNIADFITATGELLYNLLFIEVGNTGTPLLVYLSGGLLITLIVIKIIRE